MPSRTRRSKRPPHTYYPKPGRAFRPSHLEKLARGMGVPHSLAFNELLYARHLLFEEGGVRIAHGRFTDSGRFEPKEGHVTVVVRGNLPDVPAIDRALLERLFGKNKFDVMMVGDELPEGPDWNS